MNLLEVMSSKDCIFMVLELVTGGELFDKIVAEGPMKASSRCWQLLAAMALHAFCGAVVHTWLVGWWVDWLHCVQTGGAVQHRNGWKLGRVQTCRWMAVGGGCGTR